MTTTPEEPTAGTDSLSDADLGSSPEAGGAAGTGSPHPGGDADGTDGGDADGTDGSDGDSTDGSDGDGSDADGTDGTDGAAL